MACFSRDRVDVGALVGGKLHVISSDVSLEGVMFAKGLITRWVLRASKSIVTFMGCYMSPESRPCQEALCTSFPITFVFSFLSVRAFDVLVQMLLVEI